MNLSLAAALLFGSGFAALVYQTVWQRLFCLIFGASTGASAAVLGIFLGGLGLGGAWLGKRAERSERPLFLYGQLELVVVACAALTPFLSDAAARLYFALGGSNALGTSGATVVRLVLALVVMGPATVAMGGTLPAMARAVEVEGDAQRERLAVLYAVNTLGAVVGSLLGTFVLFELFGHRTTLWFACLINLLVAVLARVYSRRSHEALHHAAVADHAAEGLPTADDSTALSEQLTPLGHDSQRHTLLTQVAYWAAGAVGFSFLMLEMIWYRMLSPLLGGSTYTFGTILAVALFGIGLGGYLYARRGDREVTLRTLAATLALEAVFVALPLYLGDRIALFAAYTRPMAALGFDGLLTSWSMIAGVVVFPVALVSGYQFPVLFALLGRGRKGVAEQVGKAYAFNTVGSILGALLTGFVILPGLGAVGSWRLVVALLASACVLCLAAALRWERSSSPVPVLSTVGTVSLLGVALASFTALGPTGVWRHEPIGAGRTEFLPGLDSNGLKQWLAESRARTVWEVDGKESSVRLSDNSSYAFSINGKSDGSVWEDRGTQAMLGILPAVLHPAPKRAFIVGLGTGMSAGWLGRMQQVEHVDVAELEPAILKVAEVAALANGDVLNNPKVRVFEGDAREFMLTSSELYDVIASEPSNPYRAGIASLFTEEFYAVAAEHLNPGGIFAQWVQGYEIDVTTVRTVVRTMRQVFPFVEVWQSQGGDFEIIASKEPRRYVRAEWEARLVDPVLVDLFPRAWLVEGVEGLLSHFVADADLTRSMSELGSPPINTDDGNVLEYAFARTVGGSARDGVLSLVQHAFSEGKARPVVEGEVDWARVDELRARAWLINEGSAPSLDGLSPDAAKRFSAVGQGCAGDLTQVVPIWRSQPQQETKDVVEQFVLALGHAAVGSQEALGAAERLEARGFVAEAMLIRAQYLAKRGHLAEAIDQLSLSLGEQRRKALPLCGTTTRTLTLLDQVANAHPELAKKAAMALMEGPVAAHVAERKRVDVMERLAYASTDPALCVAAMGPRAARPWWTRGFLSRRYECLKAVGSPLTAQAEEDLIEFLMATAGSFDSGAASGADSANEPAGIGPPGRPDSR